jgi:hypothetical protein
LRQTEAGNQFGIKLVSFRPCQTTGSKGFDCRRIDEADFLTGIEQIKREVLAVRAGRF